MHSCKGTHSIAASFTLLLIPSTPSAASSTITPTSTENVRVYLAIIISACVNIVCKRVAKVVKDVWAINH